LKYVTISVITINMASDDCDCSSCIDDRHESSQIIDLDPVDLDPVDLDPVDLDPVDLDPVDLDPVDLDPVDAVSVITINMASDDCDCSSCIEDDPTDEAPTPVSSPVATPPQPLLHPLGVYQLESGLCLKIQRLDDGKIETLFTLNGEEVKKDCSDTLPKG
jgi:hypothetical protein